MNVGILTFHNANNYGAVLQAYALQEVLKNKEANPEFIDYRNECIETRMHPFSFKYNSIIRILYRFLFNYRSLHQSVKNFNSFRRDYLCISKQRACIKTFEANTYSIIVIGSDQVWNTILTGGVDPFYWGNFSYEGKIFGYAVSSNDLAGVSVDNLHLMGESLKNFKSIGVREARLQSFLNDKFNIQSKIVLDPTILGGRKIFDRIVSSKINGNPYLLVYDVENNSDDVCDLAIRIARDKNLEIVVVDVKNRVNAKRWSSMVKYVQPTVPDWISYFKYADVVVCRSFHGTVFSVLYEREFYSVVGRNMERVETFLKPLGLLNRVVRKVDEIEKECIDYNRITPMLDILRVPSIEFIQEMISQASR